MEEEKRKAAEAVAEPVLKLVIVLVPTRVPALKFQLQEKRRTEDLQEPDVVIECDHHQGQPSYRGGVQSRGEGGISLVGGNFVQTSSVPTSKFNAKIVWTEMPIPLNCCTEVDGGTVQGPGFDIGLLYVVVTEEFCSEG